MTTVAEPIPVSGGVVQGQRHWLLDSIMEGFLEGLPGAESDNRVARAGTAEALS